MSLNTNVGVPNSYPPTPTNESSPASKAERRKRFEDVYNDIRDELVSHFESQGMPRESIEWYKRNLDYNVPGGKLNRGLSVVDSCRVLLQRELTEEEEWKSSVLGWCIELLQAYFLTSDDMMDSSVTRRGQPCYYRLGSTTVQYTDPQGKKQPIDLPPVNTIAVNDALMLECALYHVIKRYFRKEKWYVDVLEAFLETSYQTEMGQLIDLITAPEGDVNLSRFSLEKHRLIVVYKTAFYSFYLPVALAMHVCGVPSPHSFASLVKSGQSGLTSSGSTSFSAQSNSSSSFAKPEASLSPGQVYKGGKKDAYSQALEILIPLGEYFQVQDDYLDAFGTPEQIGKVGTDIVDNKCGWLACTALAIATPEQYAVMEKYYGVRPTEAELKAGAGHKGKGLGAAEARIKELYHEMKLEQLYKEYQEKVVTKLRALIEQVDETPSEPGGVGLKREVFTTFLEKIYGRTM